MTDIIKLAREAGMDASRLKQYPAELADLERFAELVAAPLKAEIEALRQEIDRLPIKLFLAPAYGKTDHLTSGRNDPMYIQAIEIVNKHQRYSVSLVQRHLRISYNRAASMLEHAKEDAKLKELMHGHQSKALPEGACKSCDGEGEQGGQFCGGFWKCEDCGGTGKSDAASARAVKK
jgi:hypothetical protein